MKQAVKSIEEIKAILKEHKKDVVLKYRVIEIGIFGSFVRGEQRRQSDVDICSSNSIKEISPASSSSSRWSVIWRSFSAKRLTSSERAVSALNSGKLS